MSDSSLTFNAPSWALALGISVIAVVAFLAFVAWKRTGFTRLTGILEATRVILVAMAVITLWQPEWMEVFKPKEEPAIAILWDDSSSMNTRDVLPTNRNLGVMTRAEWLKPKLEKEFWKPLEAKGSVIMESFFHRPGPGSDVPPGGESAVETGTDPATAPNYEEGTDLGGALKGLADKMSNLRAVVLFSDGDWNMGDPPAEIAMTLRTMGIPVFPVVVGSDQRLPDLELDEVKAPQFGVIGKPIQIPFTIQSSLSEDVVTKVQLKSSTGEIVEKEITIPAQDTYQDAIYWTPPREGQFNLTMTVPTQPSEIRDRNNSMTFDIQGKRERLKVLVVETRPRWEYRFLRNALSRDPGVEVSCLLMHPDIKVGGGKDYIKEFPGTIEKLSQYDVIFLGDVGTNQLTPAQCKLIKGLVENQASGLVFIPGMHGNQHSLLDTPLKDLYPVVLDRSNFDGTGTSSPATLALTAAGKGNFLTMLADTEDQNPQVWKNLPGFYWYAPVLKSKGGTEVLAVHDNKRNEFGRIPLLVTRNYGTGKVLFMGIDSAWRWRRGVEDKFHYRFWGQVARWMSYQRNVAKGDLMRLFYSPERPTPGDTMTLNATAFSRIGIPLSDAKVYAEITSPDGKTERINFIGQPGDWGLYRGKFTPGRKPGKYTITLKCENTGAELVQEVTVSGEELEVIGQPARADVLREIASLTKGQLGQSADLSAIMDAISALPEPDAVEKRYQIWSSWWWAALIIILLTAFWIGRKLAGTI